MNLKNGLGLFACTKKLSVYEGTYLDDMSHGIGYLTQKKKRSYLGEFINGLKHGVGRLKEGKTRFIGEFFKGRRQGIGIMKDGNGKTIKGYYENGVLTKNVFVKDTTEGNEYAYRG